MKNFNLLFIDPVLEFFYRMFMCQELLIHEFQKLFSILMTLILSCMSWFCLTLYP